MTRPQPLAPPPQTPLQRALARRMTLAGLSMRALAAIAGLKETAVKDILNGKSNAPRSDTVSKLAVALECSVDDLLEDRDPAPPGTTAGTTDGRDLNRIATNRLQPDRAAPFATWPRDLPVKGHAAGGGKGFFFLQGETVGLTHRPPSLTGVPDAFAVHVEGDSMAPRYDHGEMVWVHPHRPPRPRDWVLLQIRPEHEGDHPRAMIARLKKLTDEQVVAEKLNPPLTLRYPRADVLTLYVIVHGGEAV